MTTIEKRVTDLEQRGADARLPTLAESILAARGRTLPRTETTNPIIAAARLRVEQGRN